MSRGLGCPKVVWGLTASLTALCLLPACGSDTGASSTTSASQPSTGQAATAPTPSTTIPTTQSPRTEKWIDLQVGDCLSDPPPSDPSVVTVNLVNCATAHAAEVYLRAPLEVNTAVAGVATRQCDAGFSKYTGEAVNGSLFAVTYLIASNQDRTSNDPTPSTVICLLQAANGGPLTGSARH